MLGDRGVGVGDEAVEGDGEAASMGAEEDSDGGARVLAQPTITATATVIPNKGRIPRRHRVPDAVILFTGDQILTMAYLGTLKAFPLDILISPRRLG